MCIICISNKGVQQPTVNQIKQMFQTNPDGAGYMVARNDCVEIRKGFMDVSEFLDAIKREKFTKDDVVIYHFRISTQAGVCPEMTHPFPLTGQIEQTKALMVNCPCGVAHNGVISMTSNPQDHEYNDTARFIANYLNRLLRSPKDVKDSNILDMVEHLTRSKWAILDKSGYVATVGNFIRESNGLLFSNSSYQTPQQRWQNYGKFTFGNGKRY